MSSGHYRVLLLCTHPVQYAAPVFRRMANHPKLDILVAYCSLQGAEPALDSDFGVDIAWDVPLLDGYPWVHVPNRSPRPGLDRFFGLLNPGIWKLSRGGRFDAVVTYTGYRYATFWIAAAAAKLAGIPHLFATDAHELAARIRRRWKTVLKRLAWPWLLRIPEMVIVPSSGGVALMHSMGVPEEKIVLTPYAVDNDWWLAKSNRVDRAKVRARWGIPEQAAVALFCGKLQPWKRPVDVIQAFARASVPGSYLALAGEGPMRRELESAAHSLGISDRVRFLGFLNQSALPETYRSADLFVLPSEYEPFGVVVNEAMLCACPVAVSDQVGARHDLISPGENGFVFPVGDIEALAAIMRNVFSDLSLARTRGKAACERMKTWSPRENVAALAEAIASVVAQCGTDAGLGQSHPTVGLPFPNG